MPEILGTVASGLGVAEFALTVGGVLSKLTRLWIDVQEVPGTIDALKIEVGILEGFLSDTERRHGATVDQALGLQPFCSTLSTLPITVYCREALNDLQSLVEYMRREIGTVRRGKKTFAKLKAVLKKGQLAKFQERMNRALGLLQMALLSLQITHSGFHSDQLAMVSAQLDQLT